MIYKVAQNCYKNGLDTLRSLSCVHRISWPENSLLFNRVEETVFPTASLPRGGPW